MCKGSDLPSVLDMEAENVATSKHSTSFGDILVAVSRCLRSPLLCQMFSR